MIWLYFALLVSAMQWPNVVSMILWLVFLGGPPLALLIRLLARHRAQRRAIDQRQSVQRGVGEEDR